MDDQKMLDEITIKWHIQDVLMQAEQNGITLSEQEARQVLKQMEDTHDCCYGITWDTVDTCTENILRERAIAKHNN